jgi:flagellar protein FlaG
MSQDLSFNNTEANFSTQAVVIPKNEKLSNNNVTAQKVEEGAISDKFLQFSADKETSPKIAGEVSEDEVNEALEVVSTYIKNAFKDVAFSNDTNSGKTVIKVTDKETQELISQFPSDKILSMAKKIKSLHQEIEAVSGLLVDRHV